MGDEADNRGSFIFSNIGYNNNHTQYQPSQQGAYPQAPVAHYPYRPSRPLYTYQPALQSNGYSQFGPSSYPPSSHGYQPQQAVGGYHGSYPLQGGWNSYSHGGAHAGIEVVATGAAVGVALYGALKTWRERRHGHGGCYGACGYGCGHHCRLRA